MISVDEAKAAIRDALTPLPAEQVSLEGAAGRTLAAPVVAAMNQPPFNSSAMDGYAVRFSDAHKKSARLKIIGVSSAGERFSGALASGDAVRIFTGAPVPEGADHILMQEEAARDGEFIVVEAAQERAQNIRPLGIDFRKDETLLSVGARLTGPALALTAAGNVATLEVRRRPRVAVIANGDELVPPSGALGPDQIISSIPYGLCPMIEDWGGDASFLGIAPDDKESIRRMAKSAMGHDLIVTIGGASVGDRDFMRSAFADLGFKSVFEKVSVKPGKPTWFATADGTAALGLPGNPASALVTAALFLKTAIAQLLGQGEAREFFAARLGADLPANGPRETYLRAEIKNGEDGARIVTPFGNQDSSLLTVLARADVLIRRKEQAPAAKAGSLADCLPL